MRDRLARKLHFFWMRNEIWIVPFMVAFFTIGIVVFGALMIAAAK